MTESEVQNSNSVRHILDRPSELATATWYRDDGWYDLRSVDRSAGRDRSQHRRSTWLYDDLLN